jgi:hypothetical protein
MYWQFYLRMGSVYVPTTGIIQRGFYRIVEPVDVAAVADGEAVRRALFAAMARGNPKVAAPNPADRSPPFLTKYAGVKSWSSFVRNASLWGIDQDDNRYEIQGYRKDRPNGWVHDQSLDEAFPPGTSEDKVIGRMIAILQDASRTE